MSQFKEAIQILRETKSGQEAAMYPAIRDLFALGLAYEKKKILTDIAGDAGRPDVTIRAASGLYDKDGKDIDIDWIVIEAKDETDAFSNETKREAIFALKSKYITPDTAWFVMIDPTVIVARPTYSAELSINDIVLPLDGHTNESLFATRFAALSADRAGVPERLRRFREGDTAQIASEKRSHPGPQQKRPPTK